MDTTDDFVKLRRYTRAEAAALLAIPETWLKKWVTARCVQHRRSGAQRGVWFTYDDVKGIGRLLPELMTGRQANGQAEGHAAVPGAETHADLVPGIQDAFGGTLSDGVSELFGELRSPRRT